MTASPSAPPGRGRTTGGKLPVPARWQGAARLAMAHLCEAKGLAEAAVTVTHIDEVRLLPGEVPPGAHDGGPAGHRAVDVWLLGAGHAYRYRVLGGRVMPHDDV